ncbi:HNH endonuclease [Anaerosporobacter faecicola]|uniref:HNH endonuclease n=1 Tax=Anaerosporobacter faecicola TaxID=2718714 RepID=UPI00143B32F0|nr:HNH endonuclease signature motif containing protein [Anaerosporobacter faecicola]
MRVHGDVKIARRKDIVNKEYYGDFLKELREDFDCICGYCGKPEKVTRNAFEIDHFIPKSLAPELENDYNNLVYSCFTCNRKKSNKWPTKDISKCNDGNVGFIDPTSDEFDLHLNRIEDGTIIGLSPVGEYMCNNVFKFKLRPIKEIWICSEIMERQEQLEKRISKMTSEESSEYIQINMKLKELTQVLFSKKE